MKYISIEQVEPGQPLGRNVYSSDGRVLIHEGIHLTVGMIARLRNLGVTSLYIKNESDPIQVQDEEEVVNEETKREAVSRLAESMQYIQRGKDFDVKGIQGIIHKISQQVSLNKDYLLHLTDIRTKDNELFIHSVNVCIMSVLVGIKLGLSQQNIHDLAIGALFHDIGRVLDQNVNVDHSKLMETISDQYRLDHTVKGFNYLREHKEFSVVSAHVAFQHHERIDGKGYPRALGEQEIHLFAKIVAVVNHYDHLLYKGENGKPMHPYEAGEQIMGLTNTYFDYDVVWSFLRSIAYYPTGSYVRLSNGQVGVVVNQHRGLPQRPIIHLIGSSFNDGDHIDMKEIDLAKHMTLFIDKILTK